MTATIADAYQDYEALLLDLENGQTSASTVYEKIMSKEDNRINLINRVVEQKIQEKVQKHSLLNAPVKDIVKLTIHSWWDIYTDILHKKVSDPVVLFWNGDRKIFIGLLLVMMALVLFFVDISS